MLWIIILVTLTVVHTLEHVYPKFFQALESEGTTLLRLLSIVAGVTLKLDS